MMPATDKLIIYSKLLSRANQKYRWRYQYANGNKGPRSEEGFTSPDYAEDRAVRFISSSLQYRIIHDFEEK